MTITTRPTSDPIGWAIGADPGDIAVPDGSLIASGFAYLETLPHNVHNYLLREGYRWSMYLDNRLARRVEDLATITDEVDAGGLFTVDFDDRGVFKPASVGGLYATATAGGVINRVRLTGYQAIAAHVKGTTGANTNCVATCYDYNGEVLWRYVIGATDGLTPADWDSATAVTFDSTYVYVALRRGTGAGRIVRLLRTTGAYDSSGGWTDMVTLRYCNDIAVDDEAVYYATEYSGATETHGFATKASGGSAMTVIDAGYAANAVVVDGTRWYVCTDAGGSPAEVIAYTKNTNTSVWSATAGTNVLFMKMANRRLYVAGNAVSPNFLHSIDYFGTVTDHATGGVPDGLAADDRYVYLTTGNELYMHEISTGECIWYGTSLSYADPIEDADGLVTAHTDGTSLTLQVHHGRNRLFTRVAAPTVYSSPFPWNEFQPQS